ncbi:hypothetical protein PPYR_10391 [Photinus pyralis]|uniref:Uncharacterized protein n=2 Tax=Photinus pyralis TaxID=7054 RepID=A0A5N4AG54_PHOPY|nr:uncharacterized protein LOC116173050 [Photinus pyralis]KAB0796330.1 hypothetical protein PPYR_10391 [Photinus pyralis]
MHQIVCALLLTSSLTGNFAAPAVSTDNQKPQDGVGAVDGVVPVHGVGPVHPIGIAVSVPQFWPPVPPVHLPSDYGWFPTVEIVPQPIPLNDGRIYPYYWPF